MFANDFEKLNDLYNTRIFLRENVGLGHALDKGSYEFEEYEPPVRTCKCGKLEGEEAEECTCMSPSQDDMVLVGKPQSEVDVDEPKHHEVDEPARMAKQELYRIAKMAAMLHEIICDKEELEPWLVDKISRAFEGLNSVFAYKDYQQFRDKIDSEIHVEEGTEKDLFRQIDVGGTSILSKLRKTLTAESTQAIERFVVEAISTLESRKK